MAKDPVRVLVTGAAGTVIVVEKLNNVFKVLLIVVVND